MTSTFATLIKDCVGITIVGVALGWTANTLSPRGISLHRDYFAAAMPSPAATPSASATTKRGFPLAGHEEVAAWHQDPAFAAQRIVFIDARNPERYAAGHIPGAVLFDHYHPDAYVAPVLAALAIAERVVIYCTGGDCEDSELAALDLISLGVPGEKIVVYGGGMTTWQYHRLPVERERSKP